MRKAFTLAEVLITLGIIGVVAALTMPVLITHYKKNVLITRMKKFYSVLNQAVNMKIAQDGELDGSVLTAVNDPDVAMNFFDVNYAPYMKVVEKTKTPKGMAAAFPDGSGLYLRKDSCELLSTACTYVIFCVDYKKCTTVDETVSPWQAVDGKELFSFGGTDGNYPTDVGDDRETILNNCKGPYPGACTTLIVHDGWEIKDDYPW
ncbi:MAG: type II secretion system GspH family protein [Heliobacteriaceae bacterium]|jgi:prepilin-type N-terminal cleavage/methylation domain-containing protein|nr:type II secretion system GspH family protein [Heliobacteriaceae bacterium]